MLHGLFTPHRFDDLDTRGKTKLKRGVRDPGIDLDIVVGNRRAITVFLQQLQVLRHPDGRIEGDFYLFKEGKILYG